MRKQIIFVALVAVLSAPAGLAQSNTDPFSDPIPVTDGAITVNIREFEVLPDQRGEPARPMLLIDEPGTRRLFVSDMYGLLRFLNGREVSLVDPRGELGLTYPVVEWGHPDPVLLGGSAATGLIVYRDKAIPALRDRILLGDNPSGEVFHIPLDPVPSGGQDALRRVLFVLGAGSDGGDAKSLGQLVRDKNREQGREPVTRIDLRMGTGPDGRLFLLNKRDGVIREPLP